MDALLGELMLWAVHELDAHELAEFQAEVKSIFTPREVLEFLWATGPDHAPNAALQDKAQAFERVLNEWTESVRLSRHAVWQTQVAQAEDAWEHDATATDWAGFRARVLADR